MTTEAPTTAPLATDQAISPLTTAALDLISVAPPYFALDDIDDPGDGTITATVAPSPPPLPEVGAIEAAQVARHLAILGSCAAALSKGGEQRHHYLAIAASYERVGPAPLKAIREPMRATARAQWHDKRTAFASMTLAGPTGHVVNRLEVTYAVMKPAMFRRLNPLLEVESGPNSSHVSPLVDEPDRGSVIADYGPVPAELCAGHFPDHPAAPIALVMGRLVLTTRTALCSHLGHDVAYRVESGNVEATGLAQPGQRLVLEASYERENSNGTHALTGRALADGTQVGAVDVNLAALPLGVDDAQHA